MAEEQNQTDQVEEPQEETKTDWREEPGAKAMRKQIAELQRKIEAADREAEESASKRERKKLEDREQYDVLIKQRDEELSSLRSEFESKMVAKDLDIELTKAGFTNPLLLTGAKAGYDGSVPIADYVASLLADEATQALLAPAESPAAPAAKFSKPSGKSSAKSLDERLADGDPDAQRQVLAELTGINFRS